MKSFGHMQRSKHSFVSGNGGALQRAGLYKERAAQHCCNYVRVGGQTSK